MSHYFRPAGLVVAGTCIFVVLNLYSWQPGVGGAENGKGTELERYFGWPGCYRVELWRSPDPNLMLRILAVAPFYDPKPDMDLVVSGFNSLTLVIDATFAATVLAVLVIVLESTVRSAWSLRIKLVVCALGGLAVALVCLGYRISLVL